MKRLFRFFSIALTLIFTLAQLSFAQNSSMEWLRVEGNAFVKADGKKVIMRGINFSDPDRLEKIGQWKPSLFETAAAWGQ